MGFPFEKKKKSPLQALICYVSPDLSVLFNHQPTSRSTARRYHFFRGLKYLGEQAGSQVLCHRATSATCLHAWLASPYADSTQLNISVFGESASVFFTTSLIKKTILQVFPGLLPSRQAIFSVRVKMPSPSIFFSAQPLYLQSSIIHKLAGGAPK